MFKVGDRIIVKRDFKCDCVNFYKGEIGTILKGDNWVLIEWDKSKSSYHDGNGKGKENHCYWVYTDNLELYEDKVNNIRVWY